jgi:hypothetical protein
VSLFFSSAMFLDRGHFEPLLPFLLPVATKVFFRHPLYYMPEQYYLIAGYVGALSAAWVAGKRMGRHWSHSEWQLSTIADIGII